MEAPENTLPAYIKAWEQGVDAVELDVRETKDKRLICIHDDSLARVSESEYTISQETLAALKNIDVGSYLRLCFLKQQEFLVRLYIHFH